MAMTLVIDGPVEDHNLGYIISYTDTTHTSLMCYIQLQIMQLIIFGNKYISASIIFLIRWTWQNWHQKFP